MTYAIGMFATGMSPASALLGFVAALMLVYALGKTIVRGPRAAWEMLTLASLMTLGLAVPFLLTFGFFASQIGLALLSFSVVKFAKSLMIRQT